MNLLILVLCFGLFSKPVYGASGSAKVRYNCVNGTNTAECAQICENLKVSIGDLPDPLAGFHLTSTPERIAQIRRDELPYYCLGTPVTLEQKRFTGMLQPTVAPTLTTIPPTPVPTNTITPTTASQKVSPANVPSPTKPKNFFAGWYGWLKSLVQKLFFE